MNLYHDAFPHLLLQKIDEFEKKKQDPYGSVTYAVARNIYLYTYVL